MVFDVLNGSGFDRVLLLVVWFGEFILDVEFSVDSVDFFALFFFGIVASKGRGDTAGANVVTVELGKLPFFLKSVDMHGRGAEPIEDLGTNPAVAKTTTIGKHWVRGHDFVQACSAHPWEAAPDMFA